MTLEQLRIFLAVAEREHMTRAAEALHLTQSATSAAIAALEARHGVRLFDRIGRNIVLTEAGRSFVPEARAVLARAGLAERALEDMAGLERGTLRIAASQTVANYPLPAVLAAFRKAHPGIALSVRIGNTEEAVQAVGDIGADLAVIEGSAEDAAVSATRIGEDKMVLVAPPGMHVDPADPGATPWVLREPGSGTRAIFDSWYAGAAGDGPAPGIALELPSNEAVRAAVEAGAGATILSELVVGQALRAGRLRAVPVELPRRGFSLLRHRDRPETRAEAAFVALLRRALSAQLAEGGMAG